MESDLSNDDLTDVTDSEESSDMEIDLDPLEPTERESDKLPKVVVNSCREGVREYEGIPCKCYEIDVNCRTGSSSEENSLFVAVTQQMSRDMNLNHSCDLRPYRRVKKNTNKDDNSGDGGSNSSTDEDLMSILADMVRKAIGANRYSGNRGPNSFPSGPGGDPRRPLPKPTDNDPNLTFDKVGGLDEQKDYLRSSILFALTSKDAMKKWGIDPPKGIMFHGPPGTGKTMLARAFSNEISRELKQPVAFYYRKGGDCFSKWFGQSSQNLRNLFQEAIDNQPSIIFFDEIDGLCPSRDSSTLSEVNKTIVTCLLGLMDNLKRGEVFVIAATNRLETVDPAMRRPGRFDKEMAFYPPDEAGRRSILKICTSNWSRDRPSEELIRTLAHKTNGFTGADLEKLGRDAFDCAFDRCNPEFTNIVNLDNLNILKTDWMTAFGKMKKSRTSVFGSTLYIPVLPHPIVLPLISNMQKEILESLVPLYENFSSNAENSVFLKAYLIWSDCKDSATLIDTMIIPSILNTVTFVKAPIYIMSEDTILTARDPVTKVVETFQQVLNCCKPCIFLILQLDSLFSRLRNIKDVVDRGLTNMRGRPILLLASASCLPAGLNNVPNFSNLRDLFYGINRSYQVLVPLDSERKKFFQPIFEKQAISTSERNSVTGLYSSCLIKPSKGLMLELQALQDRCLQVTKGNSVNSLMVLFGELCRVCILHQETRDKHDLLVEIDTIIDRYTQNQLVG